jgi:hypothetical protein
MLKSNLIRKDFDEIGELRKLRTELETIKKQQWDILVGHGKSTKGPRRRYTKSLQENSEKRGKIGMKWKAVHESVKRILAPYQKAGYYYKYGILRSDPLCPAQVYVYGLC